MFAFALGYSRMPYAAARDGQFFAIFGKVHPTGGFPHVSLLWLIAASIPFCFFSLGQLVNWLMQVQILLRFAWQCVAVLLIARYRPDIPQPFRMWLYPIPALLSLALWIALFFTGPCHRRLVLARIPRPRPPRLRRLPPAATEQPVGLSGADAFEDPEFRSSRFDPRAAGVVGPARSGRRLQRASGSGIPYSRSVPATVGRPSRTASSFSR